jgi:hypothetical protein
MPDDSELESSATMKSLVWIREFMAALGDIGADVAATLVGETVVARFDSGGVEYMYVFDARTSAPSLSADYFRHHVIQALSRRLT